MDRPTLKGAGGVIPTEKAGAMVGMPVFIFILELLLDGWREISQCVAGHPATKKNAVQERNQKYNMVATT